MHVVDAGEPPKFLPCNIGEAEERMARKITPAIAMPVDRQLCETRQGNDASESDGVEASHNTGAAELYDEEAPGTVANFAKLANEEFYDGTRFHRCIPGFVIQGGDPLSREPGNPRVGTGGPGYTIKCETAGNVHKHQAGTLSMAHAGRDTGGSQFFICHGPQAHLDGVHTVFGQVTDGMDVVGRITPAAVVRSIRVS